MRLNRPIRAAAGLFVGLFALVAAPAATPQTAAPPMRSIRVTVSSAELLALFATPKTVVAAPGAGRMIIFEGAVLYKPAGTAYGGVGATEDLAFSYTNGSGVDVGVAETTGFVDQTTAQVRYCRPQTGALAAGTVSDFVPVANAALVLSLLVGEITTGDSVLNVRVFYRIIPSTL